MFRAAQTQCSHEERRCEHHDTCDAAIPIRPSTHNDCPGPARWRVAHSITVKAEEHGGGVENSDLGRRGHPMGAVQHLREHRTSRGCCSSPHHSFSTQGRCPGASASCAECPLPISLHPGTYPAATVPARASRLVRAPFRSRTAAENEYPILSSTSTAVILDPAAITTDPLPPPFLPIWHPLLPCPPGPLSAASSHCSRDHEPASDTRACTMLRLEDARTFEDAGSGIRNGWLDTERWVSSESTASPAPRRPATWNQQQAPTPSHRASPLIAQHSRPGTQMC